MGIIPPNTARPGFFLLHAYCGNYQLSLILPWFKIWWELTRHLKEFLNFTSGGKVIVVSLIPSNIHKKVNCKLRSVFTGELGVPSEVNMSICGMVHRWVSTIILAIRKIKQTHHRYKQEIQEGSCAHLGNVLFQKYEWIISVFIPTFSSETLSIFKLR